MVEPTVQQVIAAIHQTPHRLVFEFAGAGSLALYWIHSVPGSSRTILEATDRYAAASLSELIGQTPEKFVSAATARAMAEAAYRRAMRLTDGAGPCLGVGCTATIATDRAKRGTHGCHVAIYDGARIYDAALMLAKGARDRFGEERLVSLLVINAIAGASGIAPLALELLADEAIAEYQEERPDPLAQLLSGAIQMVTIDSEGHARVDAPPPAAMLSGAFNPLHAGHEQLAQSAAAFLDTPVAFELPVLNADKPPLGYAELERRLDQFRGRYPVVLSRARLFVQKAVLYPGCTFVLGYDTAVRLIDTRYYGSAAERDAALSALATQGCSFLVAGRVHDGVFYTLADIRLPAGFAGMFRAMPEQLFRVDLSSSAIRGAYAT